MFRKDIKSIALAFVLSLLLVISYNTSVSAANEKFTGYGDFSSYQKVIAGPSEVYGYYNNIFRKLDVYGNIIWEYKSTTGNFVNMQQHEDIILAATGTGDVFAMNATTGVIEQTYTTGIQNMHSLALNEEGKLFVVYGRYVHAFDTSSKKLWQSGMIDSSNNAIVKITDEFIITRNGSFIQISDGGIIKKYNRVVKYIDEAKNIAYLTSGETLYAVRLSDGEELWKTNNSSIYYYIEHVDVDSKGFIYYTDNVNNIVKIDPFSRERLIEKKLDKTHYDMFISKDDIIYVETGYAISSLNDELMQITETPKTYIAYSGVYEREDGSLYFVHNIYYSTTKPAAPANPGEQVKLEKVTASEQQLTFTIGDEKNVSLTATYSDGSTKDVTKDASWTASDPTIVKVEKGKVTALAAGKATVTAQFEKQQVTLDVSVKSKDLTPLPPSSATTEFAKTYVFSELVSDTVEFNKVLSQYTADELQVIVPAKHFYETKTTHIPNVLTSFALETSRDIRKIDIVVDGQTYAARRISTTTFDASVAGLYKGAEVILIGYNATGTEIAQQVIRLREGEFTIKDEVAASYSGNYSLRSLMVNSDKFNEILAGFSLEELKIGVPKRYINNPYEDIQVAYSSLSTKFTIKTTGTIGKVVIVTPNGQTYDAINKGNGVYTRDITGLQYDDLVTIQVINTNGDVVQQETAFVE